MHNLAMEQPDYSFLNDDMTETEMLKAYQKEYLNLYERGMKMVNDMQHTISNLEKEQQSWESQAQFGIKVIEHLRGQLRWYQEKYPNQKPPLADQSLQMLQKYDSIRSNKMASDNNSNNNDNNNNNNLLDPNNANNASWNNNFQNVGSAAPFGFGNANYNINIEDTKENNNSNSNNDQHDPVETVNRMRKNLVRLYTKTDWNVDDLTLLKQEMMNEMHQLKVDKIDQATYNPNIMYDTNNISKNKDFEELKKMYDQSELELKQLQIRFEETVSNYKDEIADLVKQFNIEKEEIIESKIKLLNATSKELQHLRDMIKLYNPDSKYRHVVDRIVRYHDLTPGKGNVLFQLITETNLPDNRRHPSNMARLSLSNVQFEQFRNAVDSKEDY